MPLTLDALTILDAIERRGPFNPATHTLAWQALWARALSQPAVRAKVLDAD